MLPDSLPQLLLLIFPLSVKPVFLPPNPHLSSIPLFPPLPSTFLFPHIPTSPSQILLRNIQPTLLHTEPDLKIHTKNLPKLNQLSIQPGNLLLSDFLATVRGQRRPSCAARLKSSAHFSTYGNAIFQVEFQLHFYIFPCFDEV